MIRRLLQWLSNRRAVDAGPESLKQSVFEAAERNDTSTLSSILARSGPIAVRQDVDADQLTTLHYAAASGAIEAVVFLLSDEVGADPNAARGNGFTPLHAAAMHGHASTCETLTKAGAEVDVQTEPQKYAPLHSAAFAGHVETIKVLLANGADRTLRNYRDERPIDTARRQKQQSAVEVLEATNK